MQHAQPARQARRERYLSAVVEIQRRLLVAAQDDDLYALVLPVLRDTAQASRVFVFENHVEADGRLYFRQVAEAVAEGVPPVRDDPGLEHIAFDQLMPRWRELLEAGRPVSGAVADMPAWERTYFERQGVVSALALPLIVGQTFFGFVGFHDCDDAAPWGEPEVELLQAAAAALSVTLEWQRVTGALMASEQRQRAWNSMVRLMCDTVPDLIWAKDMERRFLFTNKATCEKLLLASDTEEPVGKTDMHFATRERAGAPARRDWHTFGEQCRDSDAVVMTSGRPERFDEFGNVRGRHLLLDVYKAPMFDDAGRMIGTVGCARDVTEERAVAGRLAENEARMAATLDATPDIHLRIGRDGRFLDAFASEPARMLLPPARVIGATVSDILPPHVAEPALASIAAALASRAPVSFEYPLTVEGEERSFEARVVPCGSDDVLAVVRDVTDLRRSREELEQSALRLRDTLFQTVQAMGTMVEQRDPYTAGHERRVAALTRAVCDALGVEQERTEGLVIAAQIHDVGKVGVPAELLSTPRRLNTDERRIVQEHAARGHEILSGISFDWPVAETVYQHHERLDGSGYPRGLAGDDVSLEARIIGAADVLEAMASHRPYRAALGVDAGLAELRAGAGTLYDPAVVAACEQVVATGTVDLAQA